VPKKSQGKNPSLPCPYTVPKPFGLWGIGHGSVYTVPRSWFGHSVGTVGTVAQRAWLPRLAPLGADAAGLRADKSAGPLTRPAIELHGTRARGTEPGRTGHWSAGGGFVTRRRSTKLRVSRACEGLSDERPIARAELGA